MYVATGTGEDAIRALIENKYSNICAYTISAIIQNPPWARCECGHRRAKHFEKGMPVPCKWHRKDPKTGKEVYCDCLEYWVLKEKMGA